VEIFKIFSTLKSLNFGLDKGSILVLDGSFYIHLDSKMAHFVKVLLDEIFGGENFRNEIIWKRSTAHSDTKQGSQHYGRIHDTILFYTRSEKYVWNSQHTPHDEEYINKFYKNIEEGTGRRYMLDNLAGPGGAAKGNPFYEVMGVKRYWQFSKENMDQLVKDGRIIQTRPGNVPRYKRYLDEMKGVPLQSIWDDIRQIQSQAKERANYPTQKPEELLQRIISNSSNENDLILDVFSGSGTTAVVGEKLGRRWAVCDFGKHAIYTMQKRILNIAESKKLENNSNVADQEVARCEKCSSVIEENDEYKKCKECGSIYQNEIKEKNEKYGQPPKPFCVVSAGAYDFTRIMDLRKNQDTYITFVLGLFNIVREKTGFSKKYKLPNIYAEKNGDPVEVFPVWDDEYLKNIRIDEEYLQGIIDASGGKLKGDYYIITPETCARIGDTAFKNAAKEKGNFKLLKFPYKVLEELSRHFQIEEQATSSADINRLISSVGFYFNEEIKVEAERKNGGIKITKFNSGILDKNGRRFKGLEGLAMMLVDVDYDGKVFDMDVAIYSKDIGEDGVVKVEGLTKDSHIIAIDKHGNESKVIKLK